MKYIFSILIFCSICIVGMSQKYELRLKSLQYFCENKQMLFPTDNTSIFVLNTDQLDNGELVIGTTRQYQIDSITIEEQIHNPRYNDTIFFVNSQTPSNNGVLEKLTDVELLCSCIYQAWGLDICESYYPLVENNCCIREYKLEVSDVISIEKKDYVVIKVSSFFLGDCNSFKHIIFEFQEKTLMMCYVGTTWTP